MEGTPSGLRRGCLAPTRCGQGETEQGSRTNTSNVGKLAFGYSLGRHHTESLEGRVARAFHEATGLHELLQVADDFFAEYLSEVGHRDARGIWGHELGAHPADRRARLDGLGGSEEGIARPHRLFGAQLPCRR